MPHFNRAIYEGGWSGVALRSIVEELFGYGRRRPDPVHCAGNGLVT